MYQGRQERNPKLWPRTRAWLPWHFHMDLMAVMSRSRQALVRPCTRTRHGRMITSCSPATQYPDVRMRVTSRWHGIVDLGRSCGSKTLAPCHYGYDRAEPDQVILALKAWLIYRWQQNDGWFMDRGCRLRAWQTEVENLRREIGKRGGELALHPKTRERLHEWAPMVLH